MKKLFLTLFALVMATASLWAHDFEVDGIYYYITDETNRTVQVNYRGYSASHYSNEYTGSVTIPSSVTYDGTTYSVTWIGNYAFYGCTGLTEVTIPNSVTSIDVHAFEGCTGLSTITIPNSVTTIGYAAFSGCTSLTAVHITNLAKWCEIEFGSPNDNPFYYAHNLYLNGEKVTDLVIPNSVTSIGKYAFYNCTGLTEITIPNSVTEIGKYAFYKCTGLTEITIPNSVTSIGEYAFYKCTGLTTVHFNATNCTTMGNSSYPVFSSCSKLTTLHIGENVTCIPDYAFYECTGLTSVTIGNSVTEIGEKAFSGCSGMSEIHTLATTPPEATSLSFENCYAAHLYVPKGYKNAYQQANVWRNFNSIGSYRYTVTVNPSDESMGSVSGSGIYWDEQVVALIASANEGYEFLQWSDGNTDNPRTVIVMNDLTLTAQFIAEGSGPASYQVILQPNNNELGSVMGAGTYQENEEATLIAIPQSDILFTQWSDGNTDNPRVLTVTEDITLTAQFAQPEENIEENYQVTILSNNEMLGSVTQVRAVIIEAISTESGKFVIWSDGNSDNPRTLYPTEDITLMAIFSEASTIEGIADSNIKLYTTNEALHIENAPVGEQVTISDLSGRNVKVENVEAGRTRIALESGIYLVRIANRVVKVVV